MVWANMIGTAAWFLGCCIWVVALASNMRLRKSMLATKARLDEAIKFAEQAQAEYHARNALLNQAFGLPPGAQVIAIEVEGVEPMQAAGKRVH